MTQKTVSIIIPIYNAEKYLQQCIDSVLCQTYLEWELILVIDGATDNSAQICKEYAKENQKIKVIEKENGGVSSARNVGLDNATGDYICFMDSDDYIENDYLEILVNNLEENEADLSICSAFYREKRNKNSKRKCSNNLMFFNKKDAIINVIAGKHFGGYLWEKLFKKDIIGELRFDQTIHYTEDMLFCCEYLNKCKKVVRSDAKLYHYIKTPNSIVSAKFSRRKVTIIDSISKIVDMYKNDEEISNYAKGFFSLVNLEIFYYMIRDKINDNELKQKLKENMKNNIKYLKKCPLFPFVKGKLGQVGYQITKLFKA